MIGESGMVNASPWFQKKPSRRRRAFSSSATSMGSPTGFWTPVRVEHDQIFTWVAHAAAQNAREYGRDGCLGDEAVHKVFELPLPAIIVAVVSSGDALLKNQHPSR